MSAYTEFFLSGNRAAVQLETLEISHPNFSKVYKYVRNARKGITTDQGLFEYLPMRVESLGNRDDLDNGVRVSFGDNGEVLPKELDLVAREDGFNVKPTVKFRVYDSADLSAPLYGPLTYRIKNLSQKREGATFDASAPALNYSATGLLYRLDVFPMLRGAL